MPGFDPTSLRGVRSEPLFELFLEDEDATRRLGRALGSIWTPGETLGLVGNLGAGKTTFVQGFVSAFDPEGEASSPTYTLLNVYETEPEICHFDLYRLHDVNDLETVGYWDYADDEDAIAVVEWLDRVPDAWTRRGAILMIERDGKGRRVRAFGTNRAADFLSAFDPAHTSK